MRSRDKKRCDLQRPCARCVKREHECEYAPVKPGQNQAARKSSSSLDASERAGSAPGGPVVVGGRKEGRRVQEREVQMDGEEDRDEGAMLTFLTGESADSMHARSSRRKSKEGGSARKKVHGPANPGSAQGGGAKGVGGSGKGKEKAVDSDDDGVVDAGSRIQGGEGCETGDKKLTGGGESSIKDGRAGGASRGRGARPTGRRLGCADTTEISVFDIFSSDEEDEDEDEEEVGKEKLHSLRRGRAGRGADKLPAERQEGRGIEQAREQELNGRVADGKDSAHALPTSASLGAECATVAVGEEDASEEGTRTRGAGRVSRRTQRQQTLEQQLEAASEVSSSCTQLASSNGLSSRPYASPDAAPAAADEGEADAMHAASADMEHSSNAVGRDEEGLPGPRKGNGGAGCQGDDGQEEDSGRARNKTPAAVSSSSAVAKNTVSNVGHCDTWSAPHPLLNDE